MAILRNPLIPLALLSVALAGWLSAYAWQGVAPSEEAMFVVTYCWQISLLMWLETDACLRRRTPCFDFGFLANFLLPFSLFWHCVRTRGFGWGILLFAALTALWMGPYFVAAIVTVARSLL